MTAAWRTKTLRAGGTDLTPLRRLGMARGDVVDIADLPGSPDLVGVTRRGDGAVRIGAATTVAGLAGHPLLTAYRALTDASRQLATPQVRALATVAGNLLQRSRCPYFRQPGFSCLKRGDAGCDARSGDHARAACLVGDGCVWPHGSTLATVLTAYEAVVERLDQPALSIGDLLGDGAVRDHALPEGSLVTGVLLPDGTGEGSAYRRVSPRRHADWPLVEVAVRLRIDRTVRSARVAAGGVATTPVRLPAVEDALLDQAPTVANLRSAARLAGAEWRPPEATAYKVPLLRTALADALESAAAHAGESLVN
jgi:xanthine dehydrogenase YagS FAD-binding subunit